MLTSKRLWFNDPIIGTEQIVEDEHGPGAREARPLPSPPSVTPAQWAKHCITHLPFQPGCPICVSCRRPNTHHRQAHEAERTIPLLVADYCYVQATGDDALQTMLVMRLYPCKRFFSRLTPSQRGVPSACAKDCSMFEGHRACAIRVPLRQRTSHQQHDGRSHS